MVVVEVSVLVILGVGICLSSCIFGSLFGYMYSDAQFFSLLRLLVLERLGDPSSKDITPQEV